MHSEEKNTNQQQRLPTWIFMRALVVILMCVYLGLLIWSCLRGTAVGAAEKEWIEVLLCLCMKVSYCKTGKNSVWAMECGNTTQSAAINEGMQGWAGSGAETAAQIILCDKGAGVSWGEPNSPLTANTNRSYCLLAWDLICRFYARHIPQVQAFGYND